MKTYWRLLSYARPLRNFIAPFFITSFLASLLGIVYFTLLIPLLDVLFKQVDSVRTVVIQRPPFSVSADYPKQLFDFYFQTYLLENGRVGALQFVCILIVVAVFLSNIFRYLSSRFLENFKVNMVSRLRQAVFDNAIDLHLGFFSNERKGNLISRVVTDVQEVENSIANTFSAAFKEVFTLIIYLVTLFSISARLTLFAFLIIPITGTFIAFIVKRMRKDAREGQSRLSGLISLMDEAFGGMRVVKGFNAEGFIKEKFRVENTAYKTAIRSMAYKREMSAPFSEFMGVTVVAIILLYGGSLVLTNHSELAASEFITYIAIFSQVMRPAKEISNAFSNTQRGVASGERVLELVDTKNVIAERKNAATLPAFQHQIEFRNVVFEYEPGSPVLNNISFTIEKGKTVALVGSSGGGKSTIADLVPRFYDPSGGQILIDGHDLRDITTSSLRDQMGIVTQESILFNDTIFNNILFGSKATSDEVIAAAKIANAHNFIQDQPDGYQTVIGDRGSKLSGGQRQRISIARAILRNPAILILDEATSALDTESEKLVQEALTHLMEHRTVLVIAHRLSTIQHADEILVVNQGKIVERGNHNELLDQEEGFYKKLTLMQGL
ncbi:Putative multidrug export ATP-binding/permease protein [Dyadobacter sp. CECT 9275]|uniref:Multidrug export ATP-binding/permease protein n=1 Tax=Dyadobacter helix TaxID=2822344 RepID=A0A916JHA2_9BACT|nr:ABC transporter ATP-binding protein [Dyadobacter sp. CECT 9275]CAG5007271.1 Putative multidrug export ATP-binding/permease protein [Dyadobacter sp. CECT 9275]